jgi:AcrR family transcriptional regulator
MSARRRELTREAARLFAEKGYHGAALSEIADALGVKAPSLYTHVASKQDLLYAIMREGAEAFHRALDELPENVPVVERIRLALRAHLRVVSEQRFRDLFREGRDLGGLRIDLDDAAAALLTLSAANWAYTWLTPGRETDELADRFYALLVDGMRGYSTPA